MKKIILLAFSILFISTLTTAQTTWGDSISMRLQATVQVSPAQITLDWPSDGDVTGYTIYRKLKNTTAWGAPLASVGAAATSYVDAAVAVNTWYDYRVQSTGGVVKYGYLSSGIDLVANSNRGIALVVVENSFLSNTAYQTALTQWLTDLDLEGWYTKPIYVAKTDAVASVKSSILSKYNEEPARTKLLILIGNVPIPHSGELYPDGHSDHVGAWPTDTYYADMDGSWTDATVNNTTSANSKNHNVPGDGKPDQSYLPSDVELQVGRIDLSDLPVYTETEENLLLRYMDKLHRFKMGMIAVADKGLIDDNFTTYSEGFSQNGYRNFSVLVGRNNMAVGDYFVDLSYGTSSTGTYLWSYGCGGGTYTSAGGIGSSSNFPADSLSSVFTMLFGSYFGDWDYTNAFLRAPLAQGNTLTNCWAGRPNWHFYPMAMGENIGYSTRLTQNNNGTYFSSTISGLNKIISTNLMGEPSLRMHYIQPPTGLTILESGTSNTLNWTAAGSELGYNVYRRYVDSTQYVKLNSTLVTGTSFTDITMPVAGTAYYYVKAVELKTTPSGRYYNESLAARDSASITVGVQDATSVLAFNVYPNPFDQQLTIQSDQIEKISLHNLNGQLMYTQEWSTLSNTVQLNIGSMPAGMYLLTVTSATGKTGRTLVAH